MSFDNSFLKLNDIVLKSKLFQNNVACVTCYNILDAIQALPCV